MNLDGEIVKRLTNSDTNETYACYSPDGSKIAFISDKTGINNIYITMNEGQSEVAITNIITGATQLDWLSGNQLIFTGFYKGGYDIFVLSNIHRLIEESSNVELAKWKKNIEIPILKKSNTNNQQTNQYENFIFNSNSLYKQSNVTEFD